VRTRVLQARSKRAGRGGRGRRRLVRLPAGQRGGGRRGRRRRRRRCAGRCCHELPQRPLSRRERPEVQAMEP